MDDRCELHFVARLLEWKERRGADRAKLRSGVTDKARGAENA